MALIANIPNFIIAIMHTIAFPMMATAQWAGNLGAVSRFASVIIQGMYLGLTSTVQIAGTQMNQLWWTYFVIIIPALVTSWLAYYLGHKNFRFFARFTQAKTNNNTNK